MNSQLRKIGMIAAGGVFAATLGVASPALAGTPTPIDPPTQSHLLVHPFSGSVKLTDAVQLAGQQSDKALGYRFDNGNIVGEYFANSDKTVDTFLNEFSERFGTQPQIVGIVVDRPTSGAQDNKSQKSAALALDPISTNLPVFVAAPVPESKRESLIPASVQAATSKSSQAKAAATGWIPDTVSVRVTRVGTSQYFSNDIEWDTSSPYYIPTSFGLEVQVDLYNSATGTRYPGNAGLCGPNYRDQFIAKNHDWKTWMAYSPFGDLSSTHVYPDYNDLSDSCGKNSMAIGFQYPQRIPIDSNTAFVSTMIEAPVGLTTSSKIGGTLQETDNLNCASDGSGALTDCMGTRGLPGDERVTLNTSRNWVANPQKCWLSSNKGTTAPVASTCP